MTEVPRWLSPAELRGWSCFIRMAERLSRRVSRELQAESGLSVADHAVLVRLADVPGGRMRSSDLARDVEWEQSRMSHQISRMAKRGLVGREGCFKGGRGMDVVITPWGRQAVEAAVPGHVETVRRLFVDLLTPDELRALTRISERVLRELENRPL